MAKDVDLSSKEWTDLIFEGKNKEFGAYQMRKASNGRHNRAMLVIIVVIALLFGLSFLVNSVLKVAEAKPEDQASQELLAAQAQTDDQQEEEEEEVEVIYEEPEPEVEEVLQEELLNTQAVNAIVFTENENVEIKSTDEIKEDERALGSVDVDNGVDDIINAQEHQEAVVVEEKTPEPVVEHKVFEAVEEMPTFPGGDQALYQWIGDHLRYPQSAADEGISGRVTVRFVVKSDGSIGEVRVLRGKHPDLDKEAVRVVKALPNFQPGRQNGQAVDVWFTLPINFQLQK